MIETQIDADRLYATFQSEPTVEEIQGVVEHARNSPANIRIIDLTIPRAFQSNSDAMNLLRRDWESIGNCKFLLNIGNDHLCIHPDSRIAAMRSGLGT
jgi:hypothetical protein